MRAKRFLDKVKLAIKHKDFDFIRYDGMLLHAAQEIKQYKKNFKTSGGEVDEIERKYAFACMNSAFDVFKVFCKAHHSGCSAGITATIFQNLVDGKPLTPIQDTDHFGHVWKHEEKDGTFTDEFQCTRYSGLFRTQRRTKEQIAANLSGAISYHDVNRVVAVDINTGDTFHSGFVTNYIHDKFPIKFPYAPIKQEFKVYIQYYILKEPTENSDFDAMHILYYKQKGLDDSKHDIDLYVVCDNEQRILTPIEWEADYADKYRSC